MKGIIAAALLLIATPAIAASQVEEGRYQAVLGDCAGCHGKDLSGGIALETPFGRLVTPNITPDRQTGIGDYSPVDFRAAMKTGIARGKPLYPAMPYTAYARMPDRDVDALFAYLKTVRPVRHAVKVNQLRFPYSWRFLMRLWNLVFFHPGTPDPANHTAAWIRGEYLVNGPGHCGTCHTPKNMFGADIRPELGGALLQGWFAPDLSGDPRTGLRSWQAADVAGYLKTGRNGHSIASGPMAEAIEQSTSRMRDGDLAAIAAYLKSLPAPAGSGPRILPDVERMKRGASLYRVNCSACHGLDAKGEGPLVPPLTGNAVVRQDNADTLVRLVLAGSQGAGTRWAPTRPAMPSLAWRLNDQQVADVLSYVRGNWGNQAAPVAADTVGGIRAALRGGK
ncbi:MAG: alcohol dehydrogenase [Alphaproteobacteria bacterium 64-11]|nr:cytochrome c [Alphaproteobacteria bacterium]OJU10246.1 MAG: alcohol dehydrogenase [Alphaproteobacteria bacterium 64-11]